MISPRVEAGTVAAKVCSLGYDPRRRSTGLARRAKKLVRLVGSTMPSTAARWASAKSKAFSGNSRTHR